MLHTVHFCMYCTFLNTNLSISCRCLSSCSFCIRARRRLSASTLDASSASIVPPTLLPVGVPGDSGDKDGWIVSRQQQQHPGPNVNDHTYSTHCVFTCGQFSAGGFGDLLLWSFRFGWFSLQGAMTFDLSLAPVIGARSGGSLSERGGGILAWGAGRLGTILGWPHPENTKQNWIRSTGLLSS